MVFKGRLLIILSLQLLLLQNQQSPDIVSAAKINAKSADDSHNDHQESSVKKRTESESEENERKGGSTYKIGFGIGDVTGPAAEINMVCRQTFVASSFF